MTMANPVAAETPAQEMTTIEPVVPAVDKPANVKDVLAFLCQTFPKCFISSGPLQPLKVGIFQDLAARLTDDSGVSKTQLRQALRVYTSSWRYLEATKEGVSRVDLEGQPAELIDAQQAEHAAKILLESKQKAAEKRKANKRELTGAAKKTAVADQAPAVAKINKPTEKRTNKSERSDSKPKGKVFRTTKPETKATTSTAAPVLALNALPVSNLVVGAGVLVKLGSSPLPATVLEVNLPDVTVQLTSGMVIKTRQENLFLA